MSFQLTKKPIYSQRYTQIFIYFWVVYSIFYFYKSFVLLFLETFKEGANNICLIVSSEDYLRMNWNSIGLFMEGVMFQTLWGKYIQHLLNAFGTSMIQLSIKFQEFRIF